MKSIITNLTKKCKISQLIRKGKINQTTRKSRIRQPTKKGQIEKNLTKHNSNNGKINKSHIYHKHGK